MLLKRATLITGSLMIAISAGLTGCHDDNPLLTAPTSEAAGFLYRAQNAASKQTHLYDASGRAYELCVTNPSHYDNPFRPLAKNPCDRFLQAMVTYAKTEKIKKAGKAGKPTHPFRGLTVADLKDPAVIKRLHEALFAEASTEGQSDHLPTVPAS